MVSITVAVFVLVICLAMLGPVLGKFLTTAVAALCALGKTSTTSAVETPGRISDMAIAVPRWVGERTSGPRGGTESLEPVKPAVTR